MGTTALPAAPRCAALGSAVRARPPTAGPSLSSPGKLQPHLGKDYEAKY